MAGLINLFKRYPVAIVCMIAAIVGVVVIFMRGEVLETLQAEEEQLTSRISVIEGNAKNARDIEADLEGLQTAVSAVEERVFDIEKRAINTNFFYAFGDGMDVTVSQVTQRRDQSGLFAKSGPHELNLHSTITYDITALGNYTALIGLLHKFYAVDAIARVSNFSLTPEQNVADGGEPELRLNMQVLVLSEKE